MKRVIINGTTLSELSILTGVQRYCREIILRLDRLAAGSNIQIEYAYLMNAKNVLISLDELKNITPVAIPAKNSRIANMFELPKYIKNNDGIAVNLSPEILRSKGNIACIHDMRPIQFKQYDSKKFQLTYRLKTHIIDRFASVIVTVSDYQNAVIRNYFHIREAGRVQTIYNGWEHIRNIAPDEKIFHKFPQLNVGEFFYALGSLAPHKNFAWIMEVAKRNPDKVFAIAGGKDLKNWKDNIETNEIPNVVFLGYVVDAENKALMQNCKAFLHPSKYEGFGIPPLEALACGTPIVIANTTCLPEIYEDCAHYIDPDDYNVDLDKLLKEPVSSSEKVLNKCTWERAAKQWMELIKSKL